MWPQIVVDGNMERAGASRFIQNRIAYVSSRFEIPSFTRCPRVWNKKAEVVSARFKK